MLIMNALSRSFGAQRVLNFILAGPNRRRTLDDLTNEFIQSKQMALTDLMNALYELFDELPSPIKLNWHNGGNSYAAL